MKQYDFSKMSDDEIAALGTEYGAGPLYILCFEKQEPCQKMFAICPVGC
jgi:hypothetical protein